MTQLQQPPPQQPPPPPPDGAEGRPAAVRLREPAVVSSLTVSSCPEGQAAGAEACSIGRSTSNVSPHARQRNSYLGMDRG
jgi:hypothetical protein